MTNQRYELEYDSLALHPQTRKVVALFCAAGLAVVTSNPNKVNQLLTLQEMEEMLPGMPDNEPMDFKDLYTITRCEVIAARDSMLAEMQHFAPDGSRYEGALPEGMGLG